MDVDKAISAVQQAGTIGEIRDAVFYPPVPAAGRLDAEVMDRLTRAGFTLQDHNPLIVQDPEGKAVYNGTYDNDDELDHLLDEIEAKHKKWIAEYQDATLTAFVGRLPKGWLKELDSMGDSRAMTVTTSFTEPDSGEPVEFILWPRQGGIELTFDDGTVIATVSSWKQAVQQMRDKAAGLSDDAPASAPPAQEPASDAEGNPVTLLDGQPTVTKLIPEGRENMVRTAKGTKVTTAFALVEASELIVSHDAEGNENPLYPQVLQPRDRGRASSQAWVTKTSRDIDPDMLGRTRRADSGAPIVGPDGIVESGNGRTMAITQAYRNGRADEYREWLIEEAATFGIDPQRVERMQAPVLVRVRTSEVDRATFAVEANQDDKLSMTATEKARSDARRLTPALMDQFNPGANGDLLAASNRDFIRGFLQSLGDAEAAQYVTSTGQPTGTLIARIQAAIFAKAYQDERLLELMADTAKPEIQNIITALVAAAPEFVQARAANEAGANAASEKLAEGVELSLDEQAVRAVIDATNVVRAAREAEMTVEMYVSQMGLFGDVDPGVAAVATFIARNNRSAKRMGVAFKAMAEFVRQELENGQNFDMFGERTVDLVEVVEAANRALEREYGEGAFAIEQTGPGSTGGLFESVPAYGSITMNLFQ